MRAITHILLVFSVITVTSADAAKFPTVSALYQVTNNWSLELKDEHKKPYEDGLRQSSAATEGDKMRAVISPCVALAGADSHVSEREYYRVITLKDWTRIWQKHKGLKQDEEYDLGFNPAGLPLVDFERYMVIAIFQGNGWNSAGLRSVYIMEEQERVVLRFDDKSYQTAGPDGGGKRVRAYGFFVIPRSTKALVLQENVQGLIGKPPVWEERIMFPKLTNSSCCLTPTVTEPDVRKQQHVT